MNAVKKEGEIMKMYCQGYESMEVVCSVYHV
jgi:hypothetical protein